MRRTRSKRAAVVTVLATLASLGAVSQEARADGVAPLAFTGEAGLPAFPCEPGGEIACSGFFGGSISGQLGGEQFGAWQATIADATLNATFTYDDANTHCAAGVATGTATVTAGVGHVLGTYDRGDILPWPVTDLWAQVDFSWERAGSTAALVLGNGRVRLNVSGLGWVQVLTDGVGTALAAFAPEVDPDNQPDCVGSTNSPPLTAKVAGTAVLADPA